MLLFMHPRSPLLPLDAAASSWVFVTTVRAARNDLRTIGSPDTRLR